MTTVGILNIVFGSIGALLSVLVVLGGGLLAAAGGAAMGAENGTESAEFGGAVAAGGGLIMLIGIVGIACWTLLVASGIGVLKVRPWGRTLAIVCGVAIVALNGWGFLQNGFSVFTFGCIVYGGLLVTLMFTSDWKAAFSGEAQPAGVIEQDEFQQAA
jgi:uncharacterized membrane protein